MFALYYKLSIVFENFGEQEKAAAKNRRKTVKKGTFIGAFLAVSAKGFVYYLTNPDFTNGYKYSHILGGLLDSWDGSNSKYRAFLSHQIEGSSTALKAIQGRRHQASVYPASHADIHLEDVVFFNICVRAQSALDSQLASLEVIKHAAWKPAQSTFQSKIPPLSTNKWPRI
ncbi:hypothetical protein DSO57_1031424 [Entomophthora muscae]|uniref:Uncharacterized protein n=1 Tax=Entomophthora muscae TaxID=34485 RepID=A0ACC2T0V8_9FUNG|nr:hypothetical protein DSO57_1031424 [Entomophthora muscae]